jgi:Fe-S oxidoreductase
MTPLVENALQTFDRSIDRRLQASLEVCAHCGICAESCHLFDNGEASNHLPAAKAEQIRRFYRALHDPIGKIFPRWAGAQELSEQDLDNLVNTAFASCTLCRRCTINCPMGLDTAVVMRAARSMLTAIGKAPETLTMLADTAIARGETVDEMREFFMEGIRQLEMEVQNLLNDPSARIPVDKEGADILYVALAGAHSIVPAAAIFNAAGVNWTLSKFEAANYGIFLGDTARAKAIAKRVVDEAKRLRVKELIITECGHACASYRWDVPNWFGPDLPFRVRNILELLAEYVRERRIELDPSANSEAITYHDSCNLGRNGGLLEEPRTVLKAVAQDFREMTPNRLESYCCNGGGGMVAVPEWYERRMKGGKKKADQIKKTEARVVAVSCENCRLQITDLNAYYHLNVNVTGLTELVLNAMLAARRKKQEAIAH